MQINYFDEFDELLYKAYNAPMPPRIGEVVWYKEAYKVTNVIWYPDNDIVKILLAPWSESVGKITESFEDPVAKGRLDKMQRAILDTNKRVDATEKKTRAVVESVVSVRKSINQSIQRENKKNDDTR